MDPALACRSAMGCAQAPSHLVLDPLIRGATASVLDTWTVTWNRRFSGGSRQSQGQGKARHGFPSPRTRWVAGAYLCTREWRKRARNRKPNRQSRPSPAHPRPGDSREGEVWGVDKSLLMGGTYSSAPTLAASGGSQAGGAGRAARNAW